MLYIFTRQDAELESEEHQNPMDLVAGDIRALENPGLASIHSMFVAEHNRIAQILKSKKEQEFVQNMNNISMVWPEVFRDYFERNLLEPIKKHANAWHLIELGL